jgi:hypothetical protein
MVQHFGDALLDALECRPIASGRERVAVIPIALDSPAAPASRNRTPDQCTNPAEDIGLADDSSVRRSLRDLGDSIDKATGHRWVYDETLKIAATIPIDAPIVVDNIRSPEQLEHFRKDPRVSVVHAHL